VSSKTGVDLIKFSVKAPLTPASSPDPAVQSEGGRGATPPGAGAVPPRAAR
jgi:hypothetical protein